MPGIEDVIAEFEAKIKPVSAADIKMAKGETPVTEAVAEPAGEEIACVSKDFKKMVGVLPTTYVGMNIKDLVVEFLESIPECEV